MYMNKYNIYLNERVYLEKQSRQQLLAISFVDLIISDLFVDNLL